MIIAVELYQSNDSHSERNKLDKPDILTGELSTEEIRGFCKGKRSGDDSLMENMGRRL